jgi:hypothetical protein
MGNGAAMPLAAKKISAIRGELEWDALELVILLIHILNVPIKTAA